MVQSVIPWICSVFLFGLVVNLYIRIQKIEEVISAMTPTPYGRVLMRSKDPVHAKMVLNLGDTLGLFSAILIILLIALPCVALAQEHPIPPPPGLPHALPHPDNSHGVLYDQNCCNGTDCEPIPAAAVKLGPDGWHVEYVSPRDLIGWVRDVVPYGYEKMSRGCIGAKYCYHACAQRPTKPILNCNGMGGCQEYDFSKPAKVHCLYVDQGAASLTSYRFAGR